jgi:deoxyribonuclease-1-like protein
MAIRITNRRHRVPSTIGRRTKGQNNPNCNKEALHGMCSFRREIIPTNKLYVTCFNPASPPNWPRADARLSDSLFCMAKKLFIVLTIAAFIGGVFFVLNYDVQRQSVNGKTCWSIVPKGIAPVAAPQAGFLGQGPATLRIASFQLGRLDDAKLADHQAGDVLVRLLSQFDVIALQGVRGKNQGVLIRLVDQLNAAGGRSYDFAVCPTQQRDLLEHYSAFVFDQKRVNVDRTTVRFVEDPLGRFRFKPLMGLFQAVGPSPAEAFTFALVNAEIAPDNAAAELNVLAEAYRAVRDKLKGPNGMPEDDIILLGDLETDDRHLGPLGNLLGVTPLISGVPSTVRGANLLDNILLDRHATREFTGRAEVIDMMRAFDLTMPGAQLISEHLPIWAEFSIYEGGQAGHTAPPP